MSQMNRSLVLLGLLAGCAGRNIAPPAVSPAALASPAKESPEADAPSVAISATFSEAGPSPFTLVGTVREATFGGAPNLYRVGNSVAAVGVSRFGWTVRTLDASGKPTLVSAALSAQPKSGIEGVLAVQGLEPEDMWIVVGDTMSRAGLNAAMVRVKGNTATRTKQDLAGIGTWLDGRAVALRTDAEADFGRLLSGPQRFEVLRGAKAPLPTIPKNVRLQDVLVQASGKIFGVGKVLKNDSLDEEPWQLFVFETGKPVQSQPLGVDYYEASFVRGLPESSVVLLAKVPATKDDAAKSVLLRAGASNGDPITRLDLDLDPSAVHGTSSGSMWMLAAPPGAGNPEIYRGTINGVRFETARVPLPAASTIDRGCRVFAHAYAMVALADNDVWVSGVCGNGNGDDDTSDEEGTTQSFVLHTQAQGAVVSWQSSESILDAHRQKKVARARR